MAFAAEPMVRNRRRFRFKHEGDLAEAGGEVTSVKVTLSLRIALWIGAVESDWSA